MRSILLASAAMILSAGMAAAQTAPTATTAKPKAMAHSTTTEKSNNSGTAEHGSPMAYLKTAKTDIAKHNKAAAEDALSYAETRMLNRTQIGGMAPSSPGLTAVMNARKEVAAGDFTTASANVDKAMASEPDAVPTKAGTTSKRKSNKGRKASFCEQKEAKKLL